MAFTPCTAALGANIASDCTKPRVTGYEQTGIIMLKSDVDMEETVVSSTNYRILTNLAKTTSGKVATIYNSRKNPLPFGGTKTEYNPEMDEYTKTVQFYYQGIGGASAKNVVEPLKNGEYLIVLPRKDKGGDGSYQVFGWQSPMTATAQVCDEETGYWLITMTCSEPSAEISLFDTDVPTTKEIFDALVAEAF